VFGSFAATHVDVAADAASVGSRGVPRRHDSPVGAGAGEYEVLGERNWYLPKWLEWLPQISVEGHVEDVRNRSSATRF